MIINIDSDDTLFPFVETFIVFHNEKYKTNLKREDFVSYSFDKLIGGTMEDSICRVSEFYETKLFQEMRPFSYSVEAINYLKKLNRLYNTTSRPDSISKETIEQITNNFANSFLEIFFSANHYTEAKNCGKTKAEICLEKNVSLMIEDSLEYAIPCADKGINIFLIDAPWNQNGEHKNIIRIERYPYPNHWKEILERLKK